MARRSRPESGDLDQLSRDITDHFRGSPLAQIGEYLEQQIAMAREVLGWEGMDEGVVASFCRRCRWVLESVPGSRAISDRFWFDIQMIRAVAEEWSSADALLPGSILPRTGGEWRHVAGWLPGFGAEHLARVDIIDFPGENRLESVSLLAYPWLYHELGHILMYLHGRHFADEVNGLLDRQSQEAALSGLGKPLAVRERLKAISERRESAWRLSPNHGGGWSSEIGIDVVGLWCTGPAFLAAFDDAVEGKDPLVADQRHPPYEVRTMALLEAAKRLGWQEAAVLEERLATWTDLTAEAGRNNSYLGLFDQDVINGVVTAALSTCSRLGLHRCRRDAIQQAQHDLEQAGDLAFGRRALLAAWSQYERMTKSPDRYHAWEAATVRAMTEAVMPSSQ